MSTSAKDQVIDADKVSKKAAESAKKSAQSAKKADESAKSADESAKSAQDAAESIRGGVEFVARNEHLGAMAEREYNLGPFKAAHPVLQEGSAYNVHVTNTPAAGVVKLRASGSVHLAGFMVAR